MKSFTFQAPPNILFEVGASKKLAELVSGYGARRVLLVTDKGVRNAGLTGNAEAGLVAGGCELTVFDDVEADPPSHVIERAVALCRDRGIELVASIGGGSALDTAKLVAYLAKTLPFAIGMSYRNQPTDELSIKMLDRCLQSGFHGWYGIESPGREQIKKAIQLLKAHTIFRALARF